MVVIWFLLITFLLGCCHFVVGLFVLFLVLVGFGFLCLAMGLRFESLGWFVLVGLLVLLLFAFLISWPVDFLGWCYGVAAFLVAFGCLVLLIALYAFAVW